MTPSNYFVTGTDTEVGKTLVASALILKMRGLFPHLRVGGFKPVVAGTYLNASGQRCNEDLLSLITASGLENIQSDICPYILDEPAAPHLVAHKMGLALSMNTILESLDNRQSQCDVVIAEGAGGFLVPLNDQELLADFAVHLNWPVVLVVGLRLGCLHHALSTLESIEKRGLKLAGWVANTIDARMGLMNENIHDLQSRIQAPHLGVIPPLPSDLQKRPNSPYSVAAMEWVSQFLKLV
jgi:dethiobiotin synthetase